MVHDLDQVSNMLVLCRLHEPLPEVALDGHMEHLFLVARKARSFDLLLHFEEFLGA